MLVKPRHLDLSKLTKKKEEPVVIKKAPKKIEPKKVEAPRKPIEEEEVKIDFSFDDEEK